VANPLVSVLTPSFEQARWLDDNLRSVEAQTYERTEHIVMDGGSTDGSVGILERRTRTGLIWASRPDHGQSDAINRAFALSSGEIIGWLNSDDAYFTRDAVAGAVRIFQARPDVGVVYGHAALVNGSGTLLHVLWAPPFWAALLRWYNFIIQPTVFVRRSVLGRADFVDPAFDYMMDRELWLHLSTRTGFHRTDRIVAIDRHHDQRKSYTRLDLARRDSEALLNRYHLPRAASRRLFVKSVNFALRVAGMSRLAEAARGSTALTLDIPPVATLTVRQVAQLRRWMPPGDR
jgi:glycosyltransferase involved in cell wall biosynthesis